MRSIVQQALIPHSTWLRNLRWVSSAELAFFFICIIGVIVVAIPCLHRGNVFATICAAGGHALLVIAIAIIASRRTDTLLLAFLALSLINCTIMVWRGLPGWELITWCYGVVGVASLAVAAFRWRKLIARWRRVATYKERDDFRWLLTEAPLVLRWRFAMMLQDLRDDAK